MGETVVLKVGMSCQGCVGAVERAIAKMDEGAFVKITGKGFFLPGPEWKESRAMVNRPRAKFSSEYEATKFVLWLVALRVETHSVNLEEQKVTIVGNVKADEVLQRISKTGKPTEFWPKEESKEAKK